MTVRYAVHMGSLEEINPSLWVATSPATTVFPRLAAGASYDVIVVGAGITGLTTARLLVDQGTRVAVLDAGRVASGATGYTTAKVSALQQTHLSEIREGLGDERAKAYVDANLAAVERVAQFVSDDGIECDFERAPAITYATDEEGDAAVKAEHGAFKAAGVDVRFETESELPFPITSLVSLESQAQFNPRAYCLGLADAIARQGGGVFEHTRALDLKEVGDAVELSTDAGVVRAGHVVVASHMPFVMDGLYFARAAQYRSYALAARVPGDRVRGMYIGARGATGSVRSTADGWTIIGGEGHKVGQEDDTTARYAALEAWGRQHFDIDTIGFRWSAQDPSTLDHMPYIGRLTSRHSQTWVATGYGKWGMTNGTVAGMMLSERILGRATPWDEAFDSTRAKPMVSLKRLVKENMNVAKHLVADRLTKDGPNCTHMGCRTAFNRAEGTWDCPCHGSRFDADGRVIEGPAVKDIAPAEARANTAS